MKLYTSHLHDILVRNKSSIHTYINMHEQHYVRYAIMVESLQLQPTELGLPTESSGLNHEREG